MPFRSGSGHRLDPPLVPGPAATCRLRCDCPRPSSPPALLGSRAAVHISGIPQESGEASCSRSATSWAGVQIRMATRAQGTLKAEVFLLALVQWFPSLTLTRKGFLTRTILCPHARFPDSVFSQLTKAVAGLRSPRHSPEHPTKEAQPG